jgi:spoIIIJ-associated protein
MRPGPERTTPSLPPGELAATGQRLTEELLRSMGFEAKVSANDEEDRVNVTVGVQDDEELLTGRRGEVRQALQHLLNLMINRGGHTAYHLQLEINDFWQRREAELSEMARALAEQALASGSEAVSEYLNAQERRVVHMTLREDTRVKTYALGTGLIKRVAVAPADFPHESKPEE